MKAKNDLLVGLAIVVAIAVIVAGALWLSDRQFGYQWEVHTARFRTVGGMGVGAPVTVRGVRVGQVAEIRLADDGWVEADLRIDRTAQIPSTPAVIAASASLFGEWAATIISLDQEPPDDPSVLAMLRQAAAPGSDLWPGATLPDVGQLTAQAGRIASDIAVLTQRLGTAVDSNTAAALRSSLDDFTEIARQLRSFTRTQTETLSRATGNLASGSEDAAAAARDLRTTLARIDSATADRQLADILNSARGTSGDLREATADLRRLMEAARAHEANLVRVLVAADSVMSRLQQGSGTIGLLMSDSALYREATLTLQEARQLMADIQANPRRYFKFSVF